jgi:hypothetical protein
VKNILFIACCVAALAAAFFLPLFPAAVFSGVLLASAAAVAFA